MSAAKTCECWNRTTSAWVIRFKRTALEARQHIVRRQVLARAIGAALEFDLAFGKPLRSHHDLPGNADQVGAREFRARPLVGVVVEHVDALRDKRAVELLARAID